MGYLHLWTPLYREVAWKPITLFFFFRDLCGIILSQDLLQASGSWSIVIHSDLCIWYIWACTAQYEPVQLSELTILPDGLTYLILSFACPFPTTWIWGALPDVFFFSRHLTNDVAAIQSQGSHPKNDLQDGSSGPSWFTSPMKLYICHKPKWIYSNAQKDGNW